MQELIKTTRNDHDDLLVSGRELHSYLETATPYVKWFDRMTEYGFTEDIDFLVTDIFVPNSKGGRQKQLDHAIKLDMAKEISMIQRTTKGKEARQYFISVEKEYKQQKQLPKSPRDRLKLMYEFQEDTAKRVDKVVERVTELEENTKIDASDYGYISRRVNQRVKDVARGCNVTKKEQLSKLYKDINSGVKQITGVSTRSQLRQKDFDKVNEYINNWQPSTATLTIIKDMRDSA